MSAGGRRLLFKPIDNRQAVEHLVIAMVVRDQGQLLRGGDGRDLAVDKRRGAPQPAQPRPLRGVPLGGGFVIGQQQKGGVDDGKQVLESRVYRTFL